MAAKKRWSVVNIRSLTDFSTLLAPMVAGSYYHGSEETMKTLRLPIDVKQPKVVCTRFFSMSYPWKFESCGTVGSLESLGERSFFRPNRAPETGKWAPENWTRRRREQR